MQNALPNALESFLPIPELAEEPLSILAGAVRGAFQGVEPGTEIDRLLKGELLPLREFPVDEYRTPSSKLEFVSSTAKEKGLSALPRIIVDTPWGDEKSRTQLMP